MHNAVLEPNSPLLFHAYEKLVYHDLGDSEYMQMNGYKSVWRRDEQKPYRERLLGVVSSRYKVTQNHAYFLAIERALLQIFGSLDGIQVNDTMCYEGAVCVREYLLVKTGMNIPGTKSHLMFRVIAQNSFDGSKSVLTIAGDIDFFCTNGRISGEFERLSSPHSTSLDEARLVAFIKAAHLTFVKDVTIAGRLSGISCTPEVAVTLLKRLGDTKKFDENIATEVMRNIEAHGANLWAVVSAATWWASTREEGWANPTGEPAQAKAPLRRLERQRKVQYWMAKHIIPLLDRVTVTGVNVVTL